MTNPIDKLIDYFTNRGRKRMEVYLARSGKYRDNDAGILAKYGLPEDLIYLALIESGFSPKAYSHAKARDLGSSSRGRGGATGCGSTGGPTSAGTRRNPPTPPPPT
jgi:membrane-bound lytic murein transglycosylase D